MDDLANALPTFLTDDIDNASVVSTISTGRPVGEVQTSHASVLDLQNLGVLFFFGEPRTQSLLWKRNMAMAGFLTFFGKLG